MFERIEEYYSMISDWFAGTDGVATPVINTVSESVDEAQGWIGAKVDTATDMLFKPDYSFPDIPTAKTPLFYMVRAMSDFGSTESIDRAKTAASAGRYLSQAKSILEDLRKQGMTYVPAGGFLDAIYDGDIPTEAVTVDVALAKVDERIDHYSQHSMTAQGTGILNTTDTIIEGIQALSPLLVAYSGFNPPATRALMGAHLLGDALTGVLNFRTPGREAEFSLMQTLAPYLTMATIAGTSEVTSRIEF
jgi:hypothetical protein